MKGSVLSLHRPQVWILGGMLLFGALMHYGGLIPGINLLPPPPVALSRHTIDRILFLLPIFYAGFVYGRWGGFIIALMSIAIMTPRLLVSPAQTDAVAEVVAIVSVGMLISIWFDAQEREKSQRQQALIKLEGAQRQYQALVKMLRENQNHLSALNSIAAIVTQSLELQQILDSALDNVLEVMGLDVGWIYLLNERTQVLDLAVHRGLSPRSAAGMDRIRLEEGFNGRVAASGEPLLVENVSDDPRLTRTVVREERLQTQLVVPLQSKGKVLGTLGVASRGQRQLTHGELELLFAIGNQVGVAIENARLYQEQRSIAKQLRASEESYRSLFENASYAIFVQDLGGMVVAANQAAAELAGRQRDELVGMPIDRLLNADSLRALTEVQTRLQIGEPLEQPIELRLLRPDGREIAIEVTANVLRQGDRPVTFQYIARDVTQQRQLQETMRFYARQVTQAQEDERRRIARELHDDTAQALVALSRRIDDTLSTDGRLPSDITGRLEELRTFTDEILQGVRRFSRDLRPSILDDLGLLPALEWLTTDLNRQTGIEAILKVVNDPRRLPSETELVLFRIVQEALSNVRKHSEASKVEVTVEFDDGRVRAAVHDNGRGFDPQQVMMGDLVSTGKLGLIGMNERAQLVGGNVTVESKPSEGATVLVEVTA